MEIYGGLTEELITGNDPNLQVQRHLGGGNYGKVYCLKVLGSGKLLARKNIVLFGRVAKEDIEDEASAIDRLRTSIPNKNVVHVFRHGWLKSHNHPDNFQPVYYVDMELGRQSLEDYIHQRYRSVPPVHPQLHEIYGIVQQIASGITFIHQRGMVHRDLKPANIIQSWTNPKIWKVADFGISTPGTSANLVVTKYGRGTAEYSAPEILLFEPGKPSYTNKVDIWALGCILFELTTGERAFQTGYHAMQYSVNQRRGPCVQAVHNTNLSTPMRPMTEAEYTHINQLWHVATLLDPQLGTLVRELPLRDTTNIRVLELNRHLTSLLHPNRENRPAIDYASLSISASRIRCKMESDPDYMQLTIGTLITPVGLSTIPTPVSPGQPPLWLQRWQFLIKLDCLCCDEVNYTQYYQLHNLARRYLISPNTSQAELDRELLSLVSERGDLHWLFKNLYVFGHLLWGEGMPFRVATDLQNRIQSKDCANDSSSQQSGSSTNGSSQESIAVSAQDLLPQVVSQTYWQRPSVAPPPYYPANANYTVARSW